MGPQSVSHLERYCLRLMLVMTTYMMSEKPNKKHYILLGDFSRVGRSLHTLSVKTRIDRVQMER